MVPIMQGQRWAGRQTGDVCRVVDVDVTYDPNRKGSYSMRFIRWAYVSWETGECKGHKESLSEYQLRQRFYRAFLYEPRAGVPETGPGVGPSLKVPWEHGLPLRHESSRTISVLKDERYFRFVAPNGESALVAEDALRSFLSVEDCYELLRLRRR